MTDWHCSECGKPAEARHSEGVDPLSGETVVTPDYYICVNQDCKFCGFIIPNFRY